MKKLFFITLLSLFFGVKSSFATHVMGMDVSWKCLGNDTFEIKLVVYRRCTDGASSISLNNSSLGASSFSITSDSCANSYNVTGSIVQGSYVIDDITPVCKGGQSPCPISGGNGSSTAQIPFGVERYTIKYKIFLGGNYKNCCWYKIRWQLCCRNSNITTGYADADFYSESWINRCATPCDNGPDFKNPPVAIKCAGQDVCFNHGVIDIDGDSLSYDMAPPLGGSYVSPWSYTYPLTCLGGNTPNPNASPPTGFNLDKTSGDICFRPMQVQITVLKIMVTEWRKDSSGIYRVIGKTARDMQFAIIQNCNNKLPSLSGPFAYEACANQTICITINTNDQDLTDTTKISWNKGIPSATWNDNNGTVKRATGTLCWTPTDADASTLPYYFTATVNDDHCPLNGSTTRSYAITVKPTPKDTRTFTKKACGLWEFKAQPTSSYFNGSTYKWYVPKLVPGNPTTIYSTNATCQYQFIQGGKYIVKSTIFFNGCTNTYFDTLVVDTPINVTCMPDTHICIGKSILIDCQVKNAVPPVKYKWSTGDTTSTITKSPNVSGYFWVTVIDKDSCSASDSIFVDVKPLPTVLLPPDQRLCFGDTFNLDAQNPGSIYIWKKDGSNFSTSQVVNLSDSGQYTIRVIDTFGCEAFDTFNLFVNGKVIVGPLSDVVICNGDTAALTGSGADTYEWTNDKNSTLITGNTILVNPTVTTTYFIKGSKTAMGKTCFGYDTLTVYVNVLPTITFPNFPKRCINGGYIVLTGNLKVNNVTVPPTYVNWYSSDQPSAVIMDIITGAFYFDPTLSPKTGGTYWVIMEAIAPNGCKVKDSTTVQIVAPPFVSAGSDKNFCVNATACFNLDTMGLPSGGRWSILDATRAITYPLDSFPIGSGKWGYCFDPVKAGDGPTHNGETYQLIYYYKDILSPGCANTDTVDFTVAPIPVVDAGIDTAICQGSPILQLTTNLHTFPNDGKWWGPGVQPDSANFNPMVNMSGLSKTYTLYYKVTRIGCSGMDSVQITVNPLPQPTITASDYKICQKGTPVIITSIPGGVGSRYYLDEIEIFTLTIDPAKIDTGWHTIRYNYTDPKTLCSKDTSIKIYIELPPQVIIDPVAPICATLAQTSGIKINAHSRAPWGFRWVNIGGGTLINSTWSDSSITYLPTATQIAAGKMSLAFISTGNNYCKSDSTYIEVVIYPTPIVQFNSTNKIGCVPFTTQFLDTPLTRDGDTYYWDFGDPLSGSLNNDTSRNPIHTFNTSGIYTITLQVTSKWGCQATWTYNQMIEVYPLPIAQFTTDPSYPDWATVALPKYKFWDQTNNNGYKIKTWLWDFGDGIGTSTQQNPEYLYKVMNPEADTGWRTVTLLVVSDKGGCTDTVQHHIYIGPDLTVFIPNAFTPDDNGVEKNEKFRAVCTGIKTFEIFIFNRWGQKLYYSNDYKNHGWDGKYDGVESQMDVYIYKVIVTGFDNKKYQYSGTVHLIR